MKWKEINVFAKDSWNQELWQSRKQYFSRLFHSGNIQLFQVMRRWLAKHSCSAIPNPAQPPYCLSLCYSCKKRGYGELKDQLVKSAAEKGGPKAEEMKHRETKSGAGISVKPQALSDCGPHCPVTLLRLRTYPNLLNNFGCFFLGLYGIVNIVNKNMRSKNRMWLGVGWGRGLSINS